MCYNNSISFSFVLFLFTLDSNECSIVIVSKQSEHDDPIQYGVDTESSVQVTIHCLSDCNKKLSHLELSDSFLPGKLMEGVECCEEVVAVHEDMDC